MVIDAAVTWFSNSLAVALEWLYRGVTVLGHGRIVSYLNDKAGIRHKVCDWEDLNTYEIRHIEYTVAR